MTTNPDRYELPSITCPDCHMTSYNPNDVAEGFCGNCHAFSSRRAHRLIALPLFTREELEELYECLDGTIRAGVLGGVAGRKWSILNSLRTAVGEAKAQP